jgi:ABC-2 type transport system permease protein
MAAASPAATHKPPGFVSVLSSEWSKLRTVRSTYIQLFLAVALSLAMTGLICLAIGATWDDLSPQEQADFDLTLMGLFGSVFGLVVLVVLGVTAVSSEYTSGMMRQTLSVTPNRLHVFVAKILLVTVLSLVAGGIIAFGSFLTGQLVLTAYDIETQTLADNEVLSSILGLWLTTPIYVILAAATAFMLRSTASASTAILALIFIPSILGPLLPTWVQENVTRYIVGIAADTFVIAPEETDPTYMEPWMAVAVVAVWLTVAVGAAYALLMRRDV